MSDASSPHVEREFDARHVTLLVAQLRRAGFLANEAAEQAPSADMPRVALFATLGGGCDASPPS